MRGARTCGSGRRGRLAITIPQVDDLSHEQLALKQTDTLFEETLGVAVALRKYRM